MQERKGLPDGRPGQEEVTKSHFVKEAINDNSVFALYKDDLLIQVRGIPFVILAVLGYLLLLSHLLNLFFYTLQEVKKHLRVSLLFTYKVLMNGWVNATPISFLYTNYNSVPSATRRIRLPVTISRSSPPNVTLSATKTVSPSSIRNKK